MNHVGISLELLAVVAIQDALVLSDMYSTNRVVAFFMRHPSFVKLLAQFKSPAFRQASEPTLYL